MSTGNPSERTVRAIQKRAQREAWYNVKGLKASIDHLYVAIAELPREARFESSRQRFADAMFRTVELLICELEHVSPDDDTFLDEIRETIEIVKKLCPTVQPPVANL